MWLVVITDFIMLIVPIAVTGAVDRARHISVA